MSIKHQVAINATENIKAKITFDREAQSQGVLIRQQRGDNGILNDSESMKELLKNQQNIRIVGSGASHQNVSA